MSEGLPEPGCQMANLHWLTHDTETWLEAPVARLSFGCPSCGGGKELPIPQQVPACETCKEAMMRRGETLGCRQCGFIGGGPDFITVEKL